MIIMENYKLKIHDLWIKSETTSSQLGITMISTLILVNVINFSFLEASDQFEHTTPRTSI